MSTLVVDGRRAANRRYRSSRPAASIRTSRPTRLRRPTRAPRRAAVALQACQSSRSSVTQPRPRRRLRSTPRRTAATTGTPPRRPGRRTRVDDLSDLVNMPVRRRARCGSRRHGSVPRRAPCTDNAGNTLPMTRLRSSTTTPAPRPRSRSRPETLGSNGWYNSDVTVDYGRTRTAISNPTTCSIDQYQTTETAGQRVQRLLHQRRLVLTHQRRSANGEARQDGSRASPTRVRARWRMPPAGNNTDVEAHVHRHRTPLRRFAGPSTTKTGTSTSSREGAAVSVDSPAFVDLAREPGSCRRCDYTRSRST